MGILWVLLENVRGNEKDNRVTNPWPSFHVPADDVTEGVPSFFKFKSGISFKTGLILF